ncbi:MAG TPA: flagellar export chaperone FliS [Burkholderiaceae bacterium]|nr:flagellar export chaperone FliS [Burkholderiaceae bacterium]
MNHVQTRIRPGARSAQAYADIGLETRVSSATPEQLITLLFDGALAAIAKARLYLHNGDTSGRGKALSNAIDIVESGLKASIDTDAGGDLANNLVAVYDTVVRHLLLANMNADAANLDVAERLLADIGGAWRDIAGTRSAEAQS